MMLWEQREVVLMNIRRCDIIRSTSVEPSSPYVGELGRVVVPVDEAEQDAQHQQPHLGVLGEGEGQQRLQEGAGQRRQHVGGLEAGCHLDGRQSTGFIPKHGDNIGQTERGLFSYVVFSALTASTHH